MGWELSLGCFFWAFRLALFVLLLTAEEALATAHSIRFSGAVVVPTCEITSSAFLPAVRGWSAVASRPRGGCGQRRIELRVGPLKVGPVVTHYLERPEAEDFRLGPSTRLLVVTYR